MTVVALLVIVCADYHDSPSVGMSLTILHLALLQKLASQQLTQSMLMQHMQILIVLWIRFCRGKDSLN